MKCGAGPVMSRQEALALDRQEEEAKFAFLNPEEAEEELYVRDLGSLGERRTKNADVSLRFGTHVSLEACFGRHDWSKAEWI